MSGNGRGASGLPVSARSVRRLAFRVALQFSLAYGVASLALGFALAWLADAVPWDALTFWLLTSLVQILPPTLVQPVFANEGAMMILTSIGLTLANIALVFALLVPILRSNLSKASDLAEAFS